jgi:MFS family permease
MLTSITPLGERGRGFRWGVTLSFMLLGSTLGGAAVGVLLGLLGDATVGPATGASAEWRLYLLGALLGAAFVIELGVGGLAIPTIRRQVDERWLNAYRGWVYGFGFGAQLGAGVVTIVSTASVYVTFAACWLAGAPLPGLAIGAVFGAARAATLFGARSVRDPRALQELGRRLRRWARPARRATLACELALALVAVLAAVGT